MFHIFYIVMAIGMLFAFPASAQITCPSKPAGQINVVWGSDNIEYDFSKTQSQMDRMEPDTKNPYDRNVKVHVGGLMQGGISIKSQVQVSTLTYPRTKQVCQWVDQMNINIQIDPKILIARDHKQGTCKHNAIMEHEMKHIFVDREIVKKYVPIIRDYLQKAVLKVGIVGPKADRDQRYYQSKITDYMESALKVVSDKMYAERNRNQSAIDTREEYDRVSGLCEG